MSNLPTSKHAKFQVLYLENEQALLGFVRSLVQTLDEAKEIMQETATILWCKFDDLDSHDNFRPWAFGVARYQVLAFVRDRSRDRHIFSEDLLASLADDAEEAGLDSDQEIVALESCLRKLSDNQRELVQDAYSKDTNIKTIAISMGKTPMAIYKSLHRIRTTLSSCIQKNLTLITEV